MGDVLVLALFLPVMYVVPTRQRRADGRLGMADRTAAVELARAAGLGRRR